MEVAAFFMFFHTLDYIWSKSMKFVFPLCYYHMHSATHQSLMVQTILIKPDYKTCSVVVFPHEPSQAEIKG